MSAEASTLLLVDDEPAIRRALRPSLQHAGFTVIEAESGEEALQWLRTSPCDAVLLDMVLPGLGGVEVCRAARLDRPRLPIIMLTVQSSEDRIVAALDAGADGYVIKPFGTQELIARLRSMIRRSRLPEDDSEPIFTVGGITLDTSALLVRKDGRRVHLTPKEFHLLRVLMQHAGKTVTHTRLLQAVWGPAFGEEREYLRTLVRNLRIKIEDDPAQPRYLLSDTGCGYRFVDAADSE